MNSYFHHLFPHFYTSGLSLSFTVIPVISVCNEFPLSLSFRDRSFNLKRLWMGGWMICTLSHKG